MVCISHILVTYQLRDFWVVFTFWLLWITLLWTSVYRFLYGHVLFLLGQGGIADVVTLCWTFGGTARLFSKVAEPFHIPEGYVGSWFSTFLITLAFICLFDYNSPGARSHYILICVSLIADEAEHLSYLPGVTSGHQRSWAKCLDVLLKFPWGQGFWKKITRVDWA